MATERGQDIKFVKGQIRKTARLPSGPGRALEMKGDREMGREEGGAFTLNDRDIAGREPGGNGQTETLQEERQMENDELDDVGENHKGGGRVWDSVLDRHL